MTDHYQTKEQSPDYGQCPKKYQAREFIRYAYHEAYGRSYLPDHKHYCALSGRCTEKDSDKPLKNSEPGQLINLGFIKPHQFYGIDIDKEIIDSNKIAFPKCNWYNGEFADILYSDAIPENFNPGIIHADYIWMPKKASNHFLWIMEYIDLYHEGEVMLMCNSVIENKNKKYGHEIFTPESFEATLRDNEPFARLYYKCGFKTIKHSYAYDGTGRGSKSRMCMYAIYR